MTQAIGTDTQRGFTFLEMLVVIVVIGIIGAILAPGWLRFLDGNRLTVASSELYIGIRDAQLQAQAKKTAWQFSFREKDGRLEWATHAKSVAPANAQWQENLDAAAIQIDNETTFASSGGVYYVRFDEDGNVQYRLGRITLSSKDNPSIKRCVIVSTLIGAMRKSKEQPTPQDGKLCY